MGNRPDGIDGVAEQSSPQTVLPPPRSPMLARGAGRNATIQDVADAAGVSKAAVSKVIRNAYGVSPQMRTRVDAAIAQLGYRPRLAARAMRGTSNTMGIEIAQVSNEFLTMIVQGALETLAPTPYQLVVAPISSPGEAGAALQSLADRQVNGIVAISPKVGQEWLEQLSDRIPMVIIGRHDVSAHYDTVAGADRSGTEQVMDHLFTLGHQHILHLTIDPTSTPLADASSQWHRSDLEPHSIRHTVYLEQMRRRNLEPEVTYTGGDELEAEAVAAELLARQQRPTAIFAGNDTLAMGALRAVAAAGLGPEDVSVVGYDDITMASHPMISLTSVDQSGSKIGAEAVRLLLERIAGRTEAVQVEEQVHLRVRNSTARPRHP
ncbi:LacI family DNA-binding transcriptional regulator [Ruania halotolerans]|uniref:LacI family DNA-binding transcriptional regulator n=1 Tax=Ruania halotolerans TaxID=2897773 RepID=UPI001E48770B|nr:LacI family DNA-binding transcriptional regulator [Ruania halotolerans]UFU06546.1 LacI family transcriptional regulator [Ruania halotolerans]